MLRHKILTAVLISLLSTVASAGKKYVNQDIEGAMRSASPGDTLIIAGRVWLANENVWIKPGQAHGSPGAPITVMGAQGTHPILYGGFSIETDFWRLVNLHFRDGATLKLKTTGAEVYRCSFIGAGYSYGALIIDAEVQDVTIDGNYFEIANRRTAHHAIYIHAADNVVVRGNRIKSYGEDGMKGYGIHIYDENKGHNVDRRAHNYVVEKNIISGVHDRAGIIVAYGGEGSELHGAIIRNNVIYDCKVGIMIKNNVFDVKIYNNTIFGLVGDNPKGIQLRRVETGIEIKNNIIYSEDGDSIVLQLPQNPNLDIDNNLYYPGPKLSEVSDSHPIVANPNFVNPDPDDPDLSLQASSPAIDSGVNLGLPYSGSAPDLGAIEFGAETDVKKKEPVANPTGFRLHQNYPNPFNPETQITYEIAESSHVRVAVFDLAGRQITTLANEEQSAGTTSVTWNGKDDDGNSVASGVYFYRVEISNMTGEETATRKMVLVH